MARITPSAEPATPELAVAFQGYRKLLVYVPNSVLILQRRPQMVHALGQLLAAAWAPDSTVDAGFKRLIAYMASYAAGRQYCVAHQVSGALHLDVNERKLAAIWEYETSPSIRIASASHWTTLVRLGRCQTKSRTNCSNASSNIGARSRSSRSRA